MMITGLNTGSAGMTRSHPLDPRPWALTLQSALGSPLLRPIIVDKPELRSLLRGISQRLANASTLRPRSDVFAADAIAARFILQLGRRATGTLQNGI